MKTNKHLMKKPLFVTLLLLCITVVSLGGTYIYTRSGENVNQAEDDSQTFTVVASFYPVYIAALNVAGGIDGVTVTNLTEPTTGCLHDYQLTTGDMITISNADVLLVNGGGIESFVEDVAETYPEVGIVDLSQEFIEEIAHESEEHEHDEDADSDEHDHDADEDADTESEDHDHDHGDVNAHFWMSISLYMQEVQTMADELSVLDPEHADEYAANAAAYEKKLVDLQVEEDALTHGGDVVIFHEAFEYLAEDLGMNVVGTIDLDEERQVSAGEVKDVLDAINNGSELMGSPTTWIMVEETYGSDMAERVQEETGALYRYLNPLTRALDGYEDDPDGYLVAMRANFDEIRTVLFD